MSTEEDVPKSGESRELSADEEKKLSVLKRLSKIIEESEERQTINFEDFEKCLDVFVRLYRNNEAAIRFGRSRGGYWLLAAPLSEILKKEGIDETLFEEVMFDVIQMAGNIILNREEDFIERYRKRENEEPEIVSKKLKLVRERLVDTNLIESFGVTTTSKLKLFQVEDEEFKERIIKFAIENNLVDLPAKEELMQYIAIQIIPEYELKQSIYVDFPIEKPIYDLGEKREQAEKLKKISEKSEWIGEIINEAIENFDDEFERFISLAQSRRVLREQVWKLCNGLLENRRRAITFIINAIERSKAKDLTIPQLKLIRDAVLSLAQDDINIDEIEDSMLTIGNE